MCFIIIPYRLATYITQEFYILLTSWPYIITSIFSKNFLKHFVLDTMLCSCLILCQFSWCYFYFLTQFLKHHSLSLVFTLNLLSSRSFIVSLYSSFLLHQSKRLRFFLNEFILSFILFFYLVCWCSIIFILKLSFLATSQPTAFHNRLVGGDVFS